MAYIGRSLQAGSFRQLDDISSSFNGSTTAFTMQVNSTNVSMGDVNQIQLSLGGVIQKPGTDFTISGSTLTFTTAPAANTSFFAILLGSDNGGTVTPTDGSVTGDKLASNIAIATTADASFGSKVGVNTTHPASGAGLDKFIEVQGGDPGVVLRDDTASDAVELYNAGGNFIVYTGSADAFKIDSAGHITKPLQSAFHVDPSTDQNNFGQNPDAWVNVVFGTEVFDQNADFASNTFTAPVTGRYFLNAVVRLNSVDEAANYYWLRLNTSNRIIYGTLYDLDGLGSDPNYWALTVCALTDMDANDTVTLDIIQNGGTIQTDVDGSGTHFSGFLAC